MPRQPKDYESVVKKVKGRKYQSLPRFLDTLRRMSFINKADQRKLVQLAHEVYEGEPEPKPCTPTKQAVPFVVNFTRFVNSADSQMVLFLNQAFAEGYTLPALIKDIELAKGKKVA